MAGPGLPVNVDTTYSDSSGDPSVKAHQQHHDTLHAWANLFDKDTTKVNGMTLVWNEFSGLWVATLPAGGTLGTVVPGVVIRIMYVGGNWTYAGQSITARPSTRTDIFFELVGGDSTVLDPSWMLESDTREFTS